MYVLRMYVRLLVHSRTRVRPRSVVINETHKIVITFCLCYCHSYVLKLRHLCVTFLAGYVFICEDAAFDHFCFCRDFVLCCGKKANDDRDDGHARRSLVRMATFFVFLLYKSVRFSCDDPF